MPRAYTVTPYVQAQRATYIASFYNSSKKRVTRSLGTVDLDQARTLCAGLMALFNAGASTEDEGLALEVFVSPDCFPLYFAGPAARKPETVASEVVQTLRELARDLPADFEVQLPDEVLADRVDARNTIATLRRQAAAWKAKYDLEKLEREKIGRTVLARAAKAAENAPGFEDAALEFATHLKSKTSASNVADHVRALKKFRASLPVEIVNVGDVLPEHVGRFLDARAEAGAARRKTSRRRAWHLLIARFWSFMRERYGLPSPMEYVAFPSKNSILRERGDIVWHSLDEVAAAVDGVGARLNAIRSTRKTRAGGELYWQTLIATLGYAGLQLAELCWMRVEDLQFSEDRMRAQFWVTTVAEESAGESHVIKSENRRRHVDVHPRLLLPVLKRYLENGLAGRVFLFPMPATRNRRLKIVTERWRHKTLGRWLCGNAAGLKVLETLGLLPMGMNALTLRHSFGSFLIRSGKSDVFVAAAMGNTPKVVRDHYARIRGCEVDVDF